MSMSIFRSNKETLGRLLNSFEIGGGHQEEQALVISLELPPQPTIFSGGQGDGDRAL